MGWSGSSAHTQRGSTFRWQALIEALILAGLLAPLPCRAQWPFSSPAGARPAATPFRGFSDDTNGTPSAGNDPLAAGDGQSGGAPSREIPLIEKPFNQLSNQQYGELGQKALAIKPEQWKHAETDNFIIHYRRVTEAEKVAREVEYDLWFVATSLGANKQQYSKKSHVFVFKDDQEWKTFLANTNVPQWAASFAHGDELFLNLRNTTGYGPPFDSHILAHETTHAVVARLYPGTQWPLWLNEGFAEYMAGASIASRTGQSIQAHEHTLTFAAMSLDQLQALKAYPQDPVQVAQMYETSEKLVRFVKTELPKERFKRFLEAVLGGQSLKDALGYVYPDKISSYEDFERKFARFTK